MKLLNSINQLLASSELFLAPENQNQGHQKGRKQKRRGRAGKVKLGQGGTLDPLASGVLVLGINDGTKKLGTYLHGTKEYRVTGLLGSSTDSYDSEGKRVRSAPFAHVTRDKVEAILDGFRGQIKQFPPIYSALKMDGKPLYEYARQNLPLPKPIEARDCTIYNLELVGWKNGSEHSWTGAKEELSQEEKDTMQKLENLVKSEIKEEPETTVEESNSLEKSSSANQEVKAEADLPQSSDIAQERPPVFELRMTVSSGTYVRSLVHDIALAVDSAAHVVELVRTRQGPFALDPSVSSTVEGEDSAEPLHSVVSWQVLEEGINTLRSSSSEGQEKDANGDEDMSAWEAAVVKALI